MNAAQPGATHGGSLRAAPVSGAGIGLRDPHLPQMLRDPPAVAWLELLADNYLAPGYARRIGIHQLRSRYPMTLHCVGMDLGGTDPPDLQYLGRVRCLQREVEPAWVSDHLCFSRLNGRCYHDLLPLPYTEEALAAVIERVLRIQDFLGHAIAVENVSSYVRYSASTMGEDEFLAALALRTGCGLLVDVNNAYVSAVNHGTDAETFLAGLPSESIWEVHLGGYEAVGDLLIDAHNHAVSASVWRLYEGFAARVPEVPVLIEWDNDLPSLSALLSEAAKAEVVLASDRCT